MSNEKQDVIAFPGERLYPPEARSAMAAPELMDEPAIGTPDSYDLRVAGLEEQLDTARARARTAEQQVEDLRARAMRLEEDFHSENARAIAAEAALEKINAIRNSIIGMQGFNFSEHAYPLVAALDAAGFEGAPYPEARANLGTLIEQRDRAEAETERMRTAIRTHREQQEHDRCWLDDNALYAVLGEGSGNTALPPREEFLANCARFHEQRQNPSHTPGPTPERDAAVHLVRRLRDELRWCAGNPDFSPEGQSRGGWLRGPTPALAAADDFLEGRPPQPNPEREAQHVETLREVKP